MALRTPVWRERGAPGSVLALFTVGLVLGGVTSGIGIWAVAGLAAWIPAALRTVVLAALAIAVIGHELRLVRIAFPENRRQVPQEIFSDGPYRAALGFGFALGTGVRTYVPSAIPHLLVAAMILLQVSLSQAVAVGVSFGLGRAAMAILRSASSDAAGWDAAMRRRLVHSNPLTSIVVTLTVLVLLAQ